MQDHTVFEGFACILWQVKLKSACKWMIYPSAGTFIQKYDKNKYVHYPSNKTVSIDVVALERKVGQ